jgi:hypothetical protein
VNRSETFAEEANVEDNNNEVFERLLQMFYTPAATLQF